MRNLLRKTVMLALPSALTLAAWMSLPQTVQAAASSSSCYLDGRLCSIEGDRIDGCLVQDPCYPSFYWPVECHCVDHRWECDTVGGICPD